METSNISLLVRMPNEKCKRISCASSYPPTHTIGQFKKEMIPLINTDKELGKDSMFVYIISKIIVFCLSQFRFNAKKNLSIWAKFYQTIVKHLEN